GTIFTGISAYQALKHNTMCKAQWRERGQVRADTRQATKGRTQKGGIGFGRMESNAVVSHGAAFFLQERTCLVSDAHQVVICLNCGVFPSFNPSVNNYECGKCRSKAKFGSATVPYIIKVIFQAMAAANMFMTFNASTEEDYAKMVQQRKGRGGGTRSTTTSDRKS